MMKIPKTALALSTLLLVSPGAASADGLAKQEALGLERLWSISFWLETQATFDPGRKPNNIRLLGATIEWRPGPFRFNAARAQATDVIELQSSQSDVQLILEEAFGTDRDLAEGISDYDPWPEVSLAFVYNF